MNIRDVIEPISLDEAFLDVTENKPGILWLWISRRNKTESAREVSLVALPEFPTISFLPR